MDNKVIDLFETFIAKSDQMRSFQLGENQLTIRLQFVANQIRSQLEKNFKSTIKKKNIKKEIGQDFMRAIKTLNREEKITYYNKCVDAIYSILKGFPQPEFKKSPFQGQGFTRSFNLKIWKLKMIKFDRRKNYLYAERQGIIKMYKLSQYVCRQSKNKQYNCFVLQAIANVHQQFKTVHVGFKDHINYQIVYRNIVTGIDEQTYNFIRKILNVNPIEKVQTKLQLLKYSEKTQKQQNVKLQKSQIKNIILPKNTHYQNVQQFKQIPYNVNTKKQQKQQNMQKMQQFNGRFSLVAQQNDIQQQQVIVSDSNNKINKNNLIKRLIGDEQLNSIYQYDYFEQLQSGSNWVIHKNDHKQNNLKLKIKFTQSYSKDCLVSLLTNAEQLKKINRQIQQMQIKTLFSSENSGLIYQKNKAYNKLYRPRDFVFMRHICVQNNSIYIIDKSIEQIDYPPFMTIVRGNFKIIYGIQFSKQSTVSEILIDATIENEGYLNEVQDLNLALKYLKSYIEFEQYLRHYKNNSTVFSLNWVLLSKQQQLKQIKSSKIEKSKKQISKIQQQVIQKRIVQLQHEVSVSFQQFDHANLESPQKYLNNSDNIQKTYQKQVRTVTVADLQNYLEKMEIQGQINPQQLKSRILAVPQLDKYGKVIIPLKFIKHKYSLIPKNTQSRKFQEKYEGIHHPIWKGEWKQDPLGGIIFTNQQKLQDQKGVLKFILGQIGKNLLSGKSILSLSLPVDIFSKFTNLQLCVKSLVYAPILLEKVINDNYLEKFKACIAFAFSFSSAYLVMQKPFNPVLGETFQAHIDNCPVYAQQISHHPPIVSFLMIGRGYRISAQFQSKAFMSMNSAGGMNAGIMKIQFNDGTLIQFFGPWGQVTGIVYGDRKFNLIGKCFGWIKKQNIMTQLSLNPFKGGLFSRNKKQSPSDYFEGPIYRTSQIYMDSLPAMIQKQKYKAPSKDNILSTQGKFNGVWHKIIKYEQQLIFNMDNTYPCIIQYDPAPLPSDANFRQDVVYRKLQQTTRCQKQKEIIESTQRNDRKLRTAKTKGKKH